MATALEAARLILDAHRSGQPTDRLPESCRPQSIADAYAIQDEIMKVLGPIGGWKVGTAGPAAEPSCAPVGKSVIFESGKVLSAKDFHKLALEIEFAFRILKDLPARGTAYGYDEVVEAIEFVPLIEVIGTRYREIAGLSAPEMLADANANGAFIVGAAIRDWRKIDFAAVTVELTIDGKLAQTALNTHPLGGDPAKLVVWQANHAAGRTGGLKQGDIVTTGALKGMSPAGAGKGVGTWEAYGRVEVSFN